MPSHRSPHHPRRRGRARWSRVPAAAQPAAWSRTADRARGLDQLHGILVAVDGEVVLAEAFRGPALDRPVNVKSVSKTVVAALTGAAIDRGAVAGLDTTLGEVIPDLIPPAPTRASPT